MMTPEHREELRAQITAQPQLAIDLLDQLGEMAEQAAAFSTANAALTARIRDQEATIATQADQIKALTAAAAVVLRACVGQPPCTGESYNITTPSWKSLSLLASAIAPTLTASGASTLPKPVTVQPILYHPVD